MGSYALVYTAYIKHQTCNDEKHNILRYVTWEFFDYCASPVFVFIPGAVRHRGESRAAPCPRSLASRFSTLLPERGEGLGKLYELKQCIDSRLTAAHCASCAHTHRPSETY